MKQPRAAAEQAGNAVEQSLVGGAAEAAAEAAGPVLQGALGVRLTPHAAEAVARPVMEGRTDVSTVRLVAGAAEKHGLRPAASVFRTSVVPLRAFEVFTAKGKLAEVDAAVDEGDAIAQVVAALNIKNTEAFQFQAKRLIVQPGG